MGGVEYHPGRFTGRCGLGVEGEDTPGMKDGGGVCTGCCPPRGKGIRSGNTSSVKGTLPGRKTALTYQHRLQSLVALMVLGETVVAEEIVEEAMPVLRI